MIVAVRSSTSYEYGIFVGGFELWYDTAHTKRAAPLLAVPPARCTCDYCNTMVLDLRHHADRTICSRGVRVASLVVRALCR